MERRRQGLTKNRQLPTDIEVHRSAGEPDDELVASIVDLVFDAIAKDAEGDSWLGRIILHNDRAPKRGETVLATLDVRIDDADAPLSRDFEVTSIIATVGGFTDKMLSKCIAIVGAAAQREQAIAELVSAVAKSVERNDAKHAKYQWKAKQREQETEQLRIREIGKTKRAEQRWEGFTDVAGEYHDVIQTWSDFLLDRAKGKSIKAPTLEEINTVFVGEAFDKLRAIACEMVTEPSGKRRREMSRKLKDAWQGLTEEQQGELKLRSLSALGEARARETFAWLMMPLSDPTASAK